jgi:hypothetical protein
MIAREEVEIEVRRLMSLAFPQDVVVILIANYIVARLLPAVCAAQQVAEADRGKLPCCCGYHTHNDDGVCPYCAVHAPAA